MLQSTPQTATPGLNAIEDCKQESETLRLGFASWSHMHAIWVLQYASDKFVMVERAQHSTLPFHAQEGAG